jgi:hypothetical protein
MSRRRFHLVVEEGSDPVPVEVRLRRGVKFLGRACRLRCVDCRELPGGDEGTRPQGVVPPCGTPPGGGPVSGGRGR